MGRMQAYSVTWLIDISSILLPLLFWIPVSRQGGDLRVVTGVQRPSMRDKRFNERLMFEKNNVQTLFLCLGQCDRYPDCIGIFYNKLSNNCTGHNIVFGHETGAIQDGGSRYYVKNNVRGYIGDACIISSDCSVVQSECRDNTCLCLPGYSFSPKTGECLANCAKYGDNFFKVAYHFISGNNQDVFLGVSEEDCKFLCLNRTTYICRTFEYGVNECYLSTVTSLDAPNDWYLDTAREYSYYQRDCD
ncbi:hypothetical protein CHS0354_031032 [Potamilus streckersoni]|uniref:Apple domain-containing protein n=1 Tax=Potamilus streckersoni TaxID=2493646 RepID=A0AAE0TCV7_9BIVA|nr:hypothetical protein CHS0354_031032 [Potamilus streckersoni]